MKTQWLYFSIYPLQFRKSIFIHHNVKEVMPMMSGTPHYHHHQTSYNSDGHNNRCHEWWTECLWAVRTGTLITLGQTDSVFSHSGSNWLSVFSLWVKLTQCVLALGQTDSVWILTLGQTDSGIYNGDILLVYAENIIAVSVKKFPFLRWSKLFVFTSIYVSKIFQHNEIIPLKRQQIWNSVESV